MKKHKGKIILGLFLISSSILLYFVHFLIFRDVHHLFIFLVADIAFVPLEVFFVSLVFERILEIQNSTQAKKKLFMLVEVFYLEIGDALLIDFSNADKQVENAVSKLDMTMKWTAEDFKALKKFVKGLDTIVNIDIIDIPKIYTILSAQKSLLINLISNPALTEHGTFADTILATFHLLDELQSRDLTHLSKDDMAHLKFDIERAYKGLINDWVIYMEHLSKEYPYLFYTAIISNPFIVNKKPHYHNTL